MPEAKLIAVIDDDASVARATGRLVRSLGFDVLTFTSAADYLGSARQEETACIVCDVQMPGMSGLDLYDRLKAQGSRIPIIFMSAFSADSVHRRAGNAVGVLHKPFHAAELARCLSDAVRPA